MAKNKLAGSKKGTSPSARYFQENPEARKKKNAYNSKYEETPARVKYREELNAANRKKPNGKNEDKSHTKKGGIVDEHQSKNRARNGKKGSSKK
jgi:hypothetical protein